MSLLTAIVIGGVAGWIASMIMHSQSGILMDIILGVVGAFVGTLLITALGGTGVTGINIYSVVVSVVGALIVIALGRMFTRRTM